MSEHVRTSIRNRTGHILLDRPRTLNSLSLGMVRAITDALLAWRDSADVDAVVIASTTDKAFCAGGDIRFFHDVGTGGLKHGSALLEDFFTEEYALNHLIHFYPKPYIALMDGVVMGGGMGISQAGPQARVRIVTDGTKMAMPEVNIGLFPDVGGSYFLARAPGKLGLYLGLTGLNIRAADALYVDLADLFVPQAQMPALAAMIEATPGNALREAIAAFAAPFQSGVGVGTLEEERALIDRHFGAATVPAIMASLATDESDFAQKALRAMERRSPLLMCVTHELLARGAALDVAGCLRLERALARHNFEHGEVLEGIRALAIDKDNRPQWSPATLAEVTPEMVERFFTPVWPAHTHPLRWLEDK